MLNKKILFIPLITIMFSISSCKGEETKEVKNPHAYVEDTKLIESLDNIKNVYNHDLFYMDYVGDYKLDELIEYGLSGSIVGLFAFIEYGLLNGEAPIPTGYPDFACSSFTAQSDEGHTFFGRNYDNMSDLSPFVVKTSPENGYKSINLVDTSFIKIAKGQTDDKTTDISWLVAAPYCVMDGMNEKGLAMSILVVPKPITKQADESKKTLVTNVMVRYILDHCQNIEEAKTVLNQFNMASAFTWSNYHFMISDATGKSVVVEYVKEETGSEECNKLSIVDANAVTNFYLTESMGGSGHGKDRYQILTNTLSFKKNVLTKAEALSLLSLVGHLEDPSTKSKTLWSCLYDLTSKELTLTTRCDFSQTFSFTF